MAVHERAWCIVVPHHALGARLARRRITVELTKLVPTGLLLDVVAVAAELVGNAVRHAAPLPGGVIRVAWHVTPTAEGAHVEVRVTDGGSTRVPEPRVVGPESVDGRGLTIVASLARRWGVRREGGGQCVWAQLDTPRRHAAQ